MLINPQDQNRTGNITPVSQEHRKRQWPPIVHGREVWRSAVLDQSEKPWFWHCPYCTSWVRGYQAQDVAQYAEAHIKTMHEGH